MRNLLLCLVFTLVMFTQCDLERTISSEAFDQITEGFITPADTNRLWCYYYWIGDDISMEGVTRDMEAMKKFGIGTALIGNINPTEKDGPVPLFSDKWWSIMTHAVNEGHRLGIDIGHFNCPGWSQSGGPWVTYDKAMRHLVYSEKTVQGGGERSILLPGPAGEFQDVALLKFKKIEAETRFLERKNMLFNIDGSETEIIEIQGNELAARSIMLTPSNNNFSCNVTFEAYRNNSWEVIKEFRFDRSNVDVKVGPLTHGPVTISIPETSSNRFRFRCSHLESAARMAGFANLKISEAVYLERYVEKSMGKMHPTPLPDFDSYIWATQDNPGGSEFIISDVENISDWMDNEGRVTGNFAEGEWTILRIGMTPTGVENAPAASQGKGYEIDKTRPDLAKFHFEQYMLPIIEHIPEESRHALKYVVQDSYETGSQNWTDGFAESFRSRFGYDPVKYLPVLSGRVVGSVEESDRFLWDLRRAIADDIAYGYVAGLREAAHEYGLKTWLENYGHWGYPGEFLMYGGQSDLVSGEFWNEGSLGNIECKSASSSAHIYGKPITYAEAFTASKKDFTRHPALLKKRGDWSFTEGINHLVLHVYIHQPREEAPGINAWFSTEFNRHNTWFKMGTSWADYIRRSQHLLQQGKYVADVAYFIGEDTPKMTGTRDPELPPGYAYDYINAEVIMDRLKVEDGYYVLPGGMKYAILVIPENANMRPGVLAKLEEMVNEGGTILGSMPQKSPSLEHYPHCDDDVKEIAARIWSEQNRENVFEAIPLQQALDQISVAPDISFNPEFNVLWTHRTVPGMEIYFITNQSDDTISFNPSFRVSGMEPQLWDAMNGRIRKLNDFTDNGERTSVPLHLHKHESCFIVFTNLSNSVISDGYPENNPSYEEVTSVETPWSVKFLNESFSPEKKQVYTSLESWTESDADLIKYYSGEARYATEFELSEVPDGDLFINLGKVGVMAEVILNGKNLGISWMSPFRLSANGLLKEGANSLEVHVVNVWRNRMVGDLELPHGDRNTVYTTSDIKKGEELIPSGLIGPVRIEVIQ